MPNSSLIVCEKSGDIAFALRRERLRVPDLREVRSVLQLVEALPESPASFVVLEANHANADDAVETIAAIRRDYPQCRIVVVASRELQSYQPLFREAGAVHVIFSVMFLHSVTTLAKRFFAAHETMEEDLRLRASARIPWT